MLQKTYFVAAVMLLWASPNLTRAQDASPPPGRWYAGAGAAYQRYFSINGPASQISPAYVFSGYNIKPRVALQAELQYGQRTQQSNGGESVVNGQTVSVRSQEEIKSMALTILMRYSCSRVQRPLQFDWLLGLALVHGRSSETITQTSATSSQTYIAPTATSTEPHAVMGVGLRYQLGPHLAVGSQVVVNKNLLIPPFGGFGWVLGRGANLGITYLFRSGKP